MIAPRGWIVLALSAVIMLAVCVRARASEPIPCWKAKAFLAWAGSESEAVRLAKKYGFTASQIEDAKRRCQS